MGDSDEFQNLLAKMGGVQGLSFNERSLILHFAIAGGHAPIIEYLIDNGMSITQAGNQLRTPMAVAAGVGDLEIMALLKNHGADMDAYPSGGAPPLYWAAVNDQVDAVRWLLSHGASVTNHVPLPEGAIEELERHPETYAILQDAGFLFE